MQTPLYTEDWIGLKTLDEAGKVSFINVTGGHLDIAQSDMQKYMVPYLKDEASTQLKVEASMQVTTAGSSLWLSPVWNLLMKLGGLKDEHELLLTIVD